MYSTGIFGAPISFFSLVYFTSLRKVNRISLQSTGFLILFLLLITPVFQNVSTILYTVPSHGTVNAKRFSQIFRRYVLHEADFADFHQMNNFVQMHIVYFTSALKPSDVDCNNKRLISQRPRNQQLQLRHNVGYRCYGRLHHIFLRSETQEISLCV